MNIAHQQSSCSAAILHGTEHVSDTYSTASTHLCLHFILKNHAKSKPDSNIVANLWVIDANYKSQQIVFVLSKLVLTGVCCKHFMYTSLLKIKAGALARSGRLWRRWQIIGALQVKVAALPVSRTQTAENCFGRSIRNTIFSCHRRFFMCTVSLIFN